MSQNATDLMNQQHIELMVSWIENERIFIRGAKRDVEDYERRLVLARERVRIGIAYLSDAIRQYNDWRQEMGLDLIQVEE